MRPDMPVENEDRELIPDYTQEWTPSELALKLMAIAKEQGEELSEDSLRIVDGLTYHMMTPRGATGTVKECLDLFKDSAALGKLLFDKVLPCLGPLGATAAIIKDLIGMFEEKKEDPVMKELKELEYQIRQLSDKMSIQFEDLKAFQVENNFYDKYTIEVNTLFQYMADLSSDPTQFNLDEFEKVYKGLDPKRCAYKIMSMMEFEDSNPLKWAMKADPLMKKATFTKWRDIMDNTLTHLLALEAFASGLFPDNGTIKQDQVTHKEMVREVYGKIVKFKDYVKKWEAEYRKSDEWWKKGESTLNHFVKSVLGSESFSGHEAKAERIFNEMKAILTDDQFYVVVFGDHVWRNHINRGRDLFYLEHNGYNAIVYRTPQCDQPEWFEMSSFVKDQKSVKEDPVYTSWAALKRYFTHDKIVEMSKNFPNHKLFVGVLQSKSLIAIRHTTHGSGGSEGPGTYSFDARIKHYRTWPFYNEHCCTFDVFYLSAT